MVASAVPEVRERGVAGPSWPDDGVVGVRRLVTAPLVHGMAPLLLRCLPTASTLPPPRLLRSKAKPGRKVTGWYCLATGPGRSERHAAMVWHAAPPVRNAVDAGADLLAELASAGLTAPFATLAASTPDARLILTVAPFDPAFPQLARLYRPAYARRALAALADTRVDSYVETIRYRPGQRHVLRVGGTGAVVKTYRDDTGARTVALAQTLAPVLAAACPQVLPARAWGYDETDRAAWWRVEDGEPLWSRLPSPGALGLLRLVGRAVRAVHDQGTALGSLPQHTGADEATATARASEHLGRLVPGLDARLAELVAGIRTELDLLPPPETVLTHGDLKCDNLLVAGTALRLLDLDRAALADPALDLAKLTADLRWWCTARGADADPALEAFSAGYGRDAEDRWARARVLSVLFELKLAARRTPVHDPDWLQRTVAAVEIVERRLTTGAPS